MIQVKELSFTYSNSTEIEALANINLNVEMGKCFVLCGSSGCGKSSLIKVLNGIIPHFADGMLKGDAFLDNRPIREYSAAELAEKIGTVFQNPKTQFFNTDTDSEITFGIENLGLSLEEMKERYERTVNECQIQNLTGRDIFELSGGEKQLIAFSSVYAMDQEIYLLDEPSSNLDVESISKLGKLIGKLKQNGKSIVIAEHRLYYLMDVADEFVFMEKGTIQQFYSKKEFLNISDEQRKKMGLRAINIPSIEIPLLSERISDCGEKEVLAVHNLSFFYKKKEIMAFKNISFSIKEGTITAVCGHNGAGKSTLFEVLCGLRKEKNGTVEIDGHAVSTKKRRKIFGLVMQDVNCQLFTDSVLNECLVGLRNPSIQEAKRILENLSLQNYWNAHPMTLSGGEKQRTAVASIISDDKKIILLDEPTSGLDYFHMIKLGKMLREIAKKGKSILVVTHDTEFINAACDAVLYI